MLRVVLAAALAASATAVDRPKGSTLAPSIKYTGTHAFLHSYDSLPKVLLLVPSGEKPEKIEEEEGVNEESVKKEGTKKSEPPGWFTSVAVKFKDGRKKTASFAWLEGEEARKVAARFGLSELPTVGAVIACKVDGQASGQFAVYEGTLSEGAGKAVREVHAFVQSAIGDEMEGKPLPAFPPPDVPRKTASISNIELTHDNLPTHCFGGSKSLCVIALLPKGADSCPEPFADLARRHRNDPIQFAWLPAARQPEFVAGFGLEPSALPQLVAVRTGKRSRYATHAGLEPTAIGGFIDNILGGGATFKKLSELPELTPPYLLEKEEL